MKKQFWVDRPDRSVLGSFPSFEKAEKFARRYVKENEGGRLVIRDPYGPVAKVCDDALGRVWTDLAVMPHS